MIERSIKKNLLLATVMGLKDKDARVWYLMNSASVLEIEGRFDAAVWENLLRKQ